MPKRYRRMKRRGRAGKKRKFKSRATRPFRIGIRV